MTRMVSPQPGMRNSSATRGSSQHVAQRVDAVVAAPVGNQQRLLVVHAHETRRVAARRAVEPARPEEASAKNGAASMRARYCGVTWSVSFWIDGAVGLAVDALELADAGDEVVAGNRRGHRFCPHESSAISITSDHRTVKRGMREVERYECLNSTHAERKSNAVLPPRHSFSHAYPLWVIGTGFLHRR